MSATGPFANILSERAALLAVVAGAVESVAEEESEDGLGLEEEVKVAGREPVEVEEVEETVGSELEEVLETVEKVSVADVLETDVLEDDVLEVVATEEVVADEVGNDDIVIGPGPRLNRRIK